MLNIFFVFMLLSSVVVVTSSSCLLVTCVYFLTVWAMFLFCLNLSFPSLLVCSSMFQDEVSLFMVFLTLAVLLFSLCFGTKLSNNSSLFFVYSTMFICCFMVFSSANMFIIYFFYELALLPILYMIITWGVYTDRVLGSLMLFLYTAIFTLPFLWVIFLLNYSMNSWLLFSATSLNQDLFVSLLVALAFCVKLPIYGLHLWLPMAHVEAPTSGSMLLAGVLLKLGGVGLIRFGLVVNFSMLNFTLSYLLVSLVYVTMICSFQSDFKRMVAYSSVSHMMIIPILILSNNILSLKCVVLTMLFHGLSSPIMFMGVSVLYDIFKTRQILLMKSLLLINPILSFCMVLGFFFTISAPPFPSFTTEAFSFISCYSLTSISLLFFGLYVFLSLVYNLIWFISIIINSSSSSVLILHTSPTGLSFMNFMPFVSALLLGVMFIFLFMFV